MITIENLENQYIPIKRDHTQLLEYFKLRQPETPREIALCIKLWKPNLERQVRQFIESGSDHVEEYGSSEESDYLKNKGYELLGMCIGEEL